MTKRLVLPVMFVLTCASLVSGGGAPEGSGASAASDSAGEETAGSFEFVLKVYGNATMDSSLDGKDVEFLRAIIRGEEEPTELSDANGDGAVDQDDVTHVQALMADQAESVVIRDHYDRKVAVDLPVTRIVSMFPDPARLLCQLGADDRIVGADDYTLNPKHNEASVFLRAFPKILTVPNCGMTKSPSFETMMSVEPEIAFIGRTANGAGDADIMQQTIKCPTVYLTTRFWGPDYNTHWSGYDQWRTYGLLVGNYRRAEQIIAFCEEQFGAIKKRIAHIPEKQRPTCLVVSVYYNMFAYGFTQAELAGARLVTEDLARQGILGAKPNVEQALVWDPDWIIVNTYGRADVDLDIAAALPGMAAARAVKEGNVIPTRGVAGSYDPAYSVFEAWYLASQFYPEEFADVDLVRLGDQILEFFYGAPGLFSYDYDRCSWYHDRISR